MAGAARTWALPMLFALYRTPEESRKGGVVPKTPPRLMRGLLAIWMRWFPQRKTVFAGDGGFASHELAAFASRHSNRLSLVSKFPPGAILHDRSPLRRPGGVTRKIEVITGTGYRYRRGPGACPTSLARVHDLTGVRDLTGSHREEVFFSTAVRMNINRIVEAFVFRLDIEVTFEEMREHLGLETTRGRCRNTVLRVEPCLFCLYTLVVYWFDHLSE